MTDFDEIDPAIGGERAARDRGALLNDQIAVLGSCRADLPGRKRHRSGGHRRMLERRQAGVLIVDVAAACSGSSRSGTSSPRGGTGTRREGRPRWAPSCARSRRAATGRSVAYAVHSYERGGYGTVPLVDAERRPLGVVTVTDVIRWLAGLFPRPC